LGEEVVALRQVRGLGRRCPIVPDCSFEVPREFQQMGAHRVQAVMFRDARIVFKRIQQFQALRRAVHHGRRDGAIQRDHWVVGHALEQIIKRQDLRPIRVLGAGSLVVNGGNGGLQLVWADGAFVAWPREARLPR